MWEVAGSSRGQTNTVAFAVASVSGSEDYMVFLDKDKKIGSVSQHLLLIIFGTLKNSHTVRRVGGK